MSEFEQVSVIIESIGNICDISKDNAIPLLVAFNWDEGKIKNLWSYKAEEICNSLGIVQTSHIDPQRGLRQAPCGLCNEDTPCQSLECYHSICPSCIEGYATSKVMDGELNLKCPIACCGKLASSSLIIKHLSVEANVMFNQSLANHFICSRAKNDKNALVYVDNALAASHRLYKMIKGYVTTLWRKKMILIASSVMVIFLCRFFCVTNTTSCSVELLFVNSLAIVFNAWGNLMKTLLFCLLYKLVQEPTNTVWIVGGLSILCTAYVILYALGGSLLWIMSPLLALINH